MLYVVVFYAIIEIMKLYYDKKSKNPTYFIQQGFRNGKKTSTRNVAVIGKHCDLLKITDDPLAYAKQKVAEYNHRYYQFLSTSPAWGTTGLGALADAITCISIHVPRVGDDQENAANITAVAQFLSTSPAWGTTDIWVCIAL